MNRLIQRLQWLAPEPVRRLAWVFALIAVLGCAVLAAAFLLPYGIFWGPLIFLLLLWIGFQLLRDMLLPLSDMGAGKAPDTHDPAWEAVAHRLHQLESRMKHARQSRRALLKAIRRELRGPLSRAKLHAELVEAGPSRDALLGELSQMRELVSALVEVERLGLGRKSLRRTPCDLLRLLKGFSRTGLQIEHDEGLPELLLDATRMQLLLRNLINNALWHNDKSRGDVRVQLRREGKGLRLTIRDFGPGVSAEALPRLGEAFFRIERPGNELTPAVGGLGLGLHLCRLITAAHGGQLVFRNREIGFEAQLTLA